jgi:hypothetical protein
MSQLTLTEVMYLREMMRQDYLRNAPAFKWLAHFIAPTRLKTAADDKSNKQKQTRAIIKNKGGLALRTFTSGMSNGATPRARPWFLLGVNNPAKTKGSISKKYFSQCEQVLNSHFNIGNLYRILPIAYKDVGLFSTAAYMMLPDLRYGFWFYPLAMGTYGFAVNAKGSPNMFYRDVCMTVRQVVDEYSMIKPGGGVDYGGIPSWVVQHYENARYTEEIILSQVIVENASYNPERAKVSIRPSDKKYVCYTFVQSGAGNLPLQANRGFRTELSTTHKPTSEFVKVSGYNYFPVIIPRWEVQAEGTWGCDGPGDMALGDIMSLNEMEKARLEGVHKLVRPPMVGPASLKRHQASILAGGITYVDDAGAQHGFKPAFEMDPKLYELIQCENEYGIAIDEAFYVDLFRQFSRGESKTHVSVEEIREKSSERMAMVAPALGQLDFDQNSKLIENAMFILEAQGRMPKRPRELEGEQNTIEYISILAQAAKASLMNSVERGANFLTSFAQSVQKPEIISIIHEEKYARKYLEYVGVDPELIRDEDEVDAIRQQIAQDKQMAKSLQVDAQAAATAKDLSQAQPGQGSLLDTWMDASNG